AQAKRSGALQTRDRSDPWRSRISGAPLSARLRASSTRYGAAPHPGHMGALYSSDLAAAVLRRGDDLQVLVRAGDGAERFVDVPLILHLGRLLGADGVHLHDHLV